MIRKVYLELTNRCNLNCIMCYRNTWHEPQIDLDESLIKSCIDEINRSTTIETVVIGGIGEPSVAPSIISVLNSIVNKQIVVTTNGTNTDSTFIKALVQHVDRVVVSIDGSEDMFLKMRGISIQVVLNFLDELNKEKRNQSKKTPHISFQMTLSTDTQQDIRKVLQWAKEKSAQQVIISQLLPTSHEDSEKIMYTRYENKMGKQLARGTNLLACRMGLEVNIPAMELKTERHCRFIEDSAIVILSNGDVVPCYRLAHDGKEWVFGREKNISAHVFGNVSHQSMDEIWNQSDYVRFRKTLKEQSYPSCIDCDLVEGCDMVRKSDIDCYSNMPSCGDCLWARNIVYCV